MRDVVGTGGQQLMEHQAPAVFGRRPQRSNQAGAAVPRGPVGHLGVGKLLREVSGPHRVDGGQPIYTRNTRICSANMA